MRVVAPIVEGDGEVAALPILLRRIGAWLSPEVPATIAQPIRVRRDRFLTPFCVSCAGQSGIRSLVSCGCPVPARAAGIFV